MATATIRKTLSRHPSNGRAMQAGRAAKNGMDSEDVASARAIWRWSVKQYHDLIAHGILTSDDHVELLEGEIVPKMSRNPPHEYARRLFHRALYGIIPDKFFLDAQGAVTLSDSEPEPDLYVVRGAEEDFGDKHPSHRDLSFVVEVADSSLQEDQGRKQRIYAAAGIPEYCIVNLIDRRVEMYRGPVKGRSPTYRHCTVYLPGDAVPIIIDGKEVGRVKVADLLTKKK